MAIVFYDDIPQVLEKLAQALMNEDTALIMKEAHTIKGASDNIKARALSEAALMVEKAASSGKHKDAFRLFKLLKIELEKVRNALVKSGIMNVKSLEFF